MVSWCSVGFAKIINLDCNPKGFGDLSKNAWAYDYFKATIDTDKKTYNVKAKGHKTVGNKETFVDDLNNTIIQIDETSITYRSLNNPEIVNKFNYGSDFKVIQIEPKPNFVGGWNLNCTKEISIVEQRRSNIDEAKAVCKELGYKTESERFADCSLKILEINMNAQNSQQQVQLLKSMAESAEKTAKAQKIANLIRVSQNLNQLYQDLSKQNASSGTTSLGTATCRVYGTGANKRAQCLYK